MGCGASRQAAEQDVRSVNGAPASQTPVNNPYTYDVSEGSVKYHTAWEETSPTSGTGPTLQPKILTLPKHDSKMDPGSQDEIIASPHSVPESATGCESDDEDPEVLKHRAHRRKDSGGNLCDEPSEVSRSVSSSLRSLKAKASCLGHEHKEPPPGFIPLSPMERFQLKQRVDAWQFELPVAVSGHLVSEDTRSFLASTASVGTSEEENNCSIKTVAVPVGLGSPPANDSVGIPGFEYKSYEQQMLAAQKKNWLH